MWGCCAFGRGCACASLAGGSGPRMCHWPSPKLSLILCPAAKPPCIAMPTHLIKNHPLCAREKVQPISQMFPLMWNAKLVLHGENMLSHWHLNLLVRWNLWGQINTRIVKNNKKKLLTTFSSGTDRLNVHSWLLTKESKKKKTNEDVNDKSKKY